MGWSKVTDDYGNEHKKYHYYMTNTSRTFKFIIKK